MCEQCVVIPYHYGEVFPGVHLIRARRETPTSEMGLYEWGLLNVNDPFVIFRTTPVLPTSDEDEEVVERFDKFKDEFNSTIGLDDMFKLYENFRVDFISECEKNWDEGVFKDFPITMMFEKTLCYIYMKIADFIKTSQAEPEDDTFPHINSKEGVKIDLDYDPKML